MIKKSAFMISGVGSRGIAIRDAAIGMPPLRAVACLTTTLNTDTQR